MTAYLLKTVICSAFFIAVYYVMLERVKMPVFNRVYLLFALVASFAIPMITFTTEVPVIPGLEKQIAEQVDQQDAVLVGELHPRAVINLFPIILAAIYLLVSAFLLLRFIVNMARLFLLIKKHQVIRTAEAKIVLLKKRTVPFSILHYVFVNEEEYRSAGIEDQIMYHELQHGRQLHSMDIMFIELLIVFCWFNPVLFLYRKAIQLNHEFLADNAVVARFNDPLSYQLLLLNKISRSNQFYAVSSSFSYKITKKRLVMITNPFNRTTNLLRAFAVIPASALAVFLFSERVVAQVSAPAGKPVAETGPSQIIKGISLDTLKKRKVSLPHALDLVEGTKEGAAPELVKEYEELVQKNKYLTEKGHQAFREFTDEERQKLKTIFLQMNQEQQVRQDVVFCKPLKPLGKSVPSQAQMQAFLNPSHYGIWVDNKKINNSSLADYKNTDFSNVMISKLYGKAKEGRSYTHHVSLMTNAYFEKTNARIRADQEPRMAFMVRPLKNQVSTRLVP